MKRIHPRQQRALCAFFSWFHGADRHTAIGCFHDVRLTCVASGWVVSGLALGSSSTLSDSANCSSAPSGWGWGGGGVGGLLVVAAAAAALQDS